MCPRLRQRHGSGSLGIGFLLLLSASCTEDPYNLNLDDTRLNPSCDSITIKHFTSYQVPPSIGSFSTLFLGNRDGFKVPYTLFRFGDLTSFNDSSYKIDSAYFQITVDSSKSDENAIGDQLFFTKQLERCPISNRTSQPGLDPCGRW